MNWLAGIESMVATTQASLEIISESNFYLVRTYFIQFGLDEPFKLRDREEMVTTGSVVLNYANHNFHIFADTCYEHQKTSYSVGGRVWGLWPLARSVNRITQKLWNSECERFRAAFLARDPVIHNLIRGAILSAMGKYFCRKCFNELGECLCWHAVPDSSRAESEVSG